MSYYTAGQCTRWVSDLCPWVPGTWGNAADWPANAARQGYPVSHTPSVGAACVWAPGYGGAHAVGHVAMVTAVSGGGITISEENWTWGPFHSDTRCIPAGIANGLSYITPKGGSPQQHQENSMTGDERLDIARAFVRTQYVGPMHREMPVPDHEFWAHRMVVNGFDSTIAEMIDKSPEAVADLQQDFARDHQ